VVAICVVLVPGDAVGAAGVPENVGDARSALVWIAAEIASNSSSISVPLTIFAGSPGSKPSLTLKSVLFM
jgi:hypothetical protein